MYGIIIYEDGDDIRAIEESTRAFNQIIREHAQSELGTGFDAWDALPVTDMQVRVLCVEDFAKWFPTSVTGLKFLMVWYAGSRLQQLSRRVLFTYMGRGFASAFPKRKFLEKQLRTVVRMDSYDDKYVQLKALNSVSPYLAAIGFPLAMSYFRHCGIPRDTICYRDDDGEMLTLSCKLVGEFFDTMRQSHLDGVAIRMKKSLNLVGCAVA